MKTNLRARLTAEFIGTAFLVAAVVGSGVMGEPQNKGRGARAALDFHSKLRAPRPLQAKSKRKNGEGLKSENPTTCGRLIG